MKTFANEGKFFKSFKTALCGVLALAMMMLAGCAGAPVKTQTVFFPPAPEEPKLQFLKGVGGAMDVEVAETGFSKSLSAFATGEEGETKPIKKPYGVRFIDGKLYVCDLQGSAVVIIDFAKNSYTTFSGHGSGHIKKPLNVAVDKTGAMFVVDAGRQQVIQFAPNGDFVRFVSMPEDKSKDVKVHVKPADVAVDDVNVYVLDMTGGSVRVFEKATGNFVKTIGAYVEGQPGGLSMPANMTLNDGKLYVTNVATGSVVVMDTSGKFLNTFGKIGDGFGDFSRPKGIAVGTEGRVWVVDNGFSNIQIFKDADKHRLLIGFGGISPQEGFVNMPTGLTLTADKGALDYWQKFAAPGFILEEIAFVANQAGPSKVSIFGLGHKQASTVAAKEGK